MKLYLSIFLVLLCIVTACDKQSSQTCRYKLEHIEFSHKEERINPPTFIKECVYVYDVIVSQNGHKQKSKYIVNRELVDIADGDSIVFMKQNIKRIDR